MLSAKGFSPKEWRNNLTYNLPRKKNRKCTIQIEKPKTYFNEPQRKRKKSQGTEQPSTKKKILPVAARGNNPLYEPEGSKTEDGTANRKSTMTREQENENLLADKGHTAPEMGRFDIKTQAFEPNPHRTQRTHRLRKGGNLTVFDLLIP